LGGFGAQIGNVVFTFDRTHVGFEH
jgi:hypothetical protein